MSALGDFNTADLEPANLRRARWQFAAAGSLLALGAPLGWLAIRWLQGTRPMVEVLERPFLLAYLTIPTMVVFVGVGLRLARQWSALQEANRRLRELSFTDPLTGVYNQRSFWHHLSLEHTRAQRRHAALHVAVMDLDHFKAVNDQYGHPVGDKVLVEVAQAMKEVVRKDEGLFRVGGEEFALIIPQSNAEVAYQLGERVRQTVKSLEIGVPARHGTNVAPVRITISIGLAGGTGEQLPRMEELYQAADKALYQAKRNGRDRVEVFSPSS